MQMVTANLTGRLPFGISDPIAFNVGLEHRREAASFDPDQLQESRLSCSAAAASASRAFPASSRPTRPIPSWSCRSSRPQQNLPVVKSLHRRRRGALRRPLDHRRCDHLVERLYASPRVCPVGATACCSVASTPGRSARRQSPSCSWARRPLRPGSRISATPTISMKDSTRRCAVRTARLRLRPSAPGSPATFDETTDVASVVGLKSGNRDLDNEEADSWSVGIVYQPVALPQLRFAADWSDITVDGGIRDLALDESADGLLRQSGLSERAGVRRLPSPDRRRSRRAAGCRPELPATSRTAFEPATSTRPRSSSPA